MLELIFVIIILGIVSSIGSQIIVQVYESYIVQRAQYRATMKTELALTQIANRLRYAIPGTVISRLNKTGTPTPITDIGTLNVNDRYYNGSDMMGTALKLLVQVQVQV